MRKMAFFVKLSVVSVLVSLGLVIWTSKMFAGSFFAGCVMMMLNFYVLLSLLEGIFEGNNTKAGGYLFLLMGKFAALGICIFLMIRFLHLDLLGFGLGFFLIAISSSYATSSLQKQPKA